MAAVDFPVISPTRVDFSFDELIGVDYAILGLIALSALIGLLRGLVREVFALCLWGSAIWLGLRYAHAAAVYFENVLPTPSVRLAVSFLAVFVASLLIGGMLSFVLSKLVSITGLGGTDRFAGFVFGLARGVLMVAVLVLLAGATPIPEDPWWRQSKLIPPFQALALWLRAQLPADLSAYIHYPTNRVKR